MKHLQDTYKHKGKRKMLISKLKEMDIKDQSILEAFDASQRMNILSRLITKLSEK